MTVGREASLAFDADGFRGRRLEGQIIGAAGKDVFLIKAKNRTGFRGTMTNITRYVAPREARCRAHVSYDPRA